MTDEQKSETDTEQMTVEVTERPTAEVQLPNVEVPAGAEQTVGIVGTAGTVGTVGTEEVVGTDGTEVAEKTGNESAAVHEAGVAVTAVPETESSVDGVVPSTDVTVRDTTQTVTDSSVLEKSAVEQSVAPVQSGSGNPSKKVWSREYVAAKIEKLQAARDARVREIADDIQKNGAVTIKEVRTRYHVTRQTAYAYMRELVKKGLAVRKKVISFVRPGGK